MANPMNSPRRIALIALTSAVLASAGCGGGGGGGNGVSNNSSIIGKVVDTTGNGVPAATVSAGRTGGSGFNGQATTLFDGGYRIGRLFPGVYTVSASTTVNGTQFTGSTQSVVSNNTIMSNALIEVAPANQQGIIQGTVTDLNNRRIAGVLVFASINVTPAQGTTATSGLEAVTDSNGFYQFPNVPTASVPYTITATALGFINATSTVTTLSPGQTQTVNFQMSPSSNAALPAPTNVLAASLTQPSTVLTPSIATHAETSAATSASEEPSTVYETIRKIMSPSYAQWSANRHLASQSTRLASHFGGFGPYAVEADVFFSQASTTNVSGYRISNSSNNNPLRAYDFLADPGATLYVDLDPLYTVDTPFNFGVQAINTQNTISAMSNTATMQPLQLVTVTSPAQGATVSNPVSVSWQAVNRATQYGVFIYNTFPSIGSTPVVQATGLSTSSTTYNVPSTLSAGNYWLVVSASDANSIDVSVSQIVPFTVAAG